MLTTNIAKPMNFSGGYSEPDAYWQKPIREGAYDAIRITAKELNQIGSPYLCKAEQRYLYIENPALQFFTLFVEDSSLRIDYTPSTVSSITAFNGESEDETGYADPYLNIHISSIKTGEKLFGLQILVGPWRGAGTKPMTMGNPSYAAERFRRAPNSADMIQDLMSFGIHSYLLTQAILLNRPTIFREATARAVTKGTAGKKGKKGKPRKVKSYRVLTINRDEVTTTLTEGGKHVITCPCWGVIGHWRRLKSGHSVWIKPHRKGKLRNAEGMYSAKEYEIVRGGAADD